MARTRTTHAHTNTTHTRARARTCRLHPARRPSGAPRAHTRTTTSSSNKLCPSNSPSFCCFVRAERRTHNNTSRFARRTKQQQQQQQHPTTQHKPQRAGPLRRANTSSPATAHSHARLTNTRTPNPLHHHLLFSPPLLAPSCSACPPHPHTFLFAFARTQRAVENSLTTPTNTRIEQRLRARAC